MGLEIELFSSLQKHEEDEWERRWYDEDLYSCAAAPLIDNTDRLRKCVHWNCALEITIDGIKKTDKNCADVCVRSDNAEAWINTLE